MFLKNVFRTLSLVLLLPVIGNAQNIKDEDIEYQYIQLPLIDIKSQIKNYNIKLVPVWEEKNAKLNAEYEAEKQKAQQELDDAKGNIPALQKVYDDQYEDDLVQYDKDVKTAEERFANEMDAYNKKSLGSKLIEKELLGQNTKPYKQLPSKPYRKTVSTPYLRFVPVPKLHTSYDYPALCNTYLKLYGFEQGNDQAANITVTLFGYDNTSPTTTTTQVSELVTSGSATRSVPVTYYHTEFSYRHPMSVSVKMPDGKEVMNVTPSEFNTYMVYKSPGSKNNYQNNEMLIKTTEEKIMQANLKKINDLVNSNYGYQPIPRKSVLYFVKNKDQKYTDLLDAFNDASMGLKLIVQDEAMATEKLTKALDKWKAAFAEMDLTDKNARIDQNVGIAIAFNLLEVNFATKKVMDGLSVLDSLNRMELSRKEKKRKEDFEMMFLELKKRK